MKENYLLPNNFSCTEETLIYPSGTYLIGRKKTVFKNEKKSTEREVTLEFNFSKKGFLLINTFIDITIDDYPTIDEELFSVEDFNILNATIQEITWRYSEHIFGKSLVEMQLNVDLDTAYFKEFCDKYGIVSIGEFTTLSIATLLTISTKGEWETIKELEMQKAKYSGSILQNSVVL